MIFFHEANFTNVFVTKIHFKTTSVAALSSTFIKLVIDLGFKSVTLSE